MVGIEAIAALLGVSRDTRNDGALLRVGHAHYQASTSAGQGQFNAPGVHSEIE
jgi:hypothetical protein